jgi:hypothetical protein
MGGRRKRAGMAPAPRWGLGELGGPAYRGLAHPGYRPAARWALLGTAPRRAGFGTRHGGQATARKWGRPLYSRGSDRRGGGWTERDLRGGDAGARIGRAGRYDRRPVRSPDATTGGTPVPHPPAIGGCLTTARLPVRSPDATFVGRRAAGRYPYDAPRCHSGSDRDASAAHQPDVRYGARTLPPAGRRCHTTARRPAGRRTLRDVRLGGRTLPRHCLRAVAQRPRYRLIERRNSCTSGMPPW